jgi:hypothetical protein
MSTKRMIMTFRDLIFNVKFQTSSAWAHEQPAMINFSIFFLHV